MLLALRLFREHNLHASVLLPSVGVVRPVRLGIEAQPAFCAKALGRHLDLTESLLLDKPLLHRGCSALGKILIVRSAPQTRPMAWASWSEPSRELLSAAGSNGRELSLTRVKTTSPCRCSPSARHLKAHARLFSTPIPERDTHDTEECATRNYLAQRRDKCYVASREVRHRTERSRLLMSLAPEAHRRIEASCSKRRSGTYLLVCCFSSPSWSSQENIQSGRTHDNKCRPPTPTGRRH